MEGNNERSKPTEKGRVGGWGPRNIFSEQSEARSRLFVFIFKKFIFASKAKAHTHGTSLIGLTIRKLRDRMGDLWFARIFEIFSVPSPPSLSDFLIFVDINWVLFFAVAYLLARILFCFLSTSIPF